MAQVLLCMQLWLMLFMLCFLLVASGPQFANKLDQLLEQVDMNQTQLCATDHIEVRRITHLSLRLQQNSRLQMGWGGIPRSRCAAGCGYDCDQGCSLLWFVNKHCSGQLASLYASTVLVASDVLVCLAVLLLTAALGADQ